MRQLVQVLIRKHVRQKFESHTVVHDYRVDAEYVPACPATDEWPATQEDFHIAGIFHADERTPLALTDAQVAEVKEIMLSNVHFQRDEEMDWRYRDHYED